MKLSEADVGAMNKKQLATVMAEGGAIDVARITELVNQSLATADTGAVTVASYAIAACWLTGLVDSYRLAKKLR